MLNNKLYRASILLLLLISSFTSFAGFGDQNARRGIDSPNPVGGFGKKYKTDPGNNSNPNPVGGFGSSSSGGGGVDILGPPPPPDPVPLDGGVSLLIAGMLGVGFRKIYKGIISKES